MAQGADVIVKLIAPIAIDALATAAEALLAGEAYSQLRSIAVNQKAALSRQRKRTSVQASDDPGTTISKDTWQYAEANFAATFGYYYQGLNSRPSSGDLPTAAGEDIMIWQSHNGLADIQAYLQIVFKDSMSPSDSIELASNLSQLFAERFKETSLDWTPFIKRFNFADKLIVDCYMVTAAATDSTGSPAGLASYCWVAYSHSDSLRKNSSHRQ